MGKSILVADGNAADRELVSKLVKIFGYSEVSEAADGVLALEHVAQKNPDVVILAIDLPKLDGLLLAEIFHLVPRFKALNVALMGPPMDKAVLERGLKTGAFGFLEKPVSPESIKAFLAAIEQSALLFPADVGLPERSLLTQVANATKSSLNLAFGEQSRIMSIEKQTPQGDAKIFEVLGQLTLSGNATIEIGLGMTQAVAKEMPKKTVSEILFAIGSQIIAKADQRYGLRADPVSVGNNVPMTWKQPQANHYALHVRVLRHGVILQKQFAISLLVGLSLP